MEIKPIEDCILKKRRRVFDFDSSESNWICVEDCAGCGWNREERAMRIQRIERGELVKNKDGKLQLVVQGNMGKFVDRSGCDAKQILVDGECPADNSSVSGA